MTAVDKPAHIRVRSRININRESRYRLFASRTNKIIFVNRRVLFEWQISINGIRNHNLIRISMHCLNRNLNGVALRGVLSIGNLNGVALGDHLRIRDFNFGFLKRTVLLFHLFGFFPHLGNRNLPSFDFGSRTLDGNHSGFRLSCHRCVRHLTCPVLESITDFWRCSSPRIQCAFFGQPTFTANNITTDETSPALPIK